MFQEPLESRSRLRRSHGGFERLEDRRLFKASPLIDPAAYTALAQVAVTAADPAAAVQNLDPISISGSTEHKPQSKVWFHDNQWWAALADTSGTWIWRLDQPTLHWNPVLKVAPDQYNADVRSVGNEAHILLQNMTSVASSKLVSVSYDPLIKTYRLWSSSGNGGSTPLLVDLGINAKSETATLDVDSTGRLWVVSDTKSAIEARYANYNGSSARSSPYSSLSGPIILASGIGGDDISVVMALPAGTKLPGGTPIAGGAIGVMWSNQVTKQFGFRIHIDGNAPEVWSADERPASQSALNVGAGMADDHLNVAVASDGTIYAAVKTSYDTTGFPKIALLVRRPNGQWDNLYEVSQDGTRPIVLLNEARNQILVAYDDGAIKFRESSASSISFGPVQKLLAGDDVTSTKQNWTDQLVVLAGGKGVFVPTSTVIVNQAPVVDAGPDLNVTVAGAVVLDGTVTDDGLPISPGSVTTTWKKQSGPGSATFGSTSAIDTTVTFSKVGTYVLRLTANDGEYTVYDEITIDYNPIAVAPQKTSTSTTSTASTATAATQTPTVTTQASLSTVSQQSLAANSQPVTSSAQTAAKSSGSSVAIEPTVQVATQQSLKIEPVVVSSTSTAKKPKK